MNFGSPPEWGLFALGAAGAIVSYGLMKGLVRELGRRVTLLEARADAHEGRISHLEADTAVCQTEIRHLVQRT